MSRSRLRLVQRELESKSDGLNERKNTEREGAARKKKTNWQKHHSNLRSPFLSCYIRNMIIMIYVLNSAFCCCCGFAPCVPARPRMIAWAAKTDDLISTFYPEKLPDKQASLKRTINRLFCPLSRVSRLHRALMYCCCNTNC